MEYCNGLDRWRVYYDKTLRVGERWLADADGYLYHFKTKKDARRFADSDGKEAGEE